MCIYKYIYLLFLSNHEYSTDFILFVNLEAEEPPCMLVTPLERVHLALTCPLLCLYFLPYSDFSSPTTRLLGF